MTTYKYAYSSGHYDVCRVVQKLQDKIKVTDIDIAKKLKLKRSTVVIYRLKLVKDGFLERNGTDYSTGRALRAWRCAKPMPYEEAKARRTVVRKKQNKLKLKGLSGLLKAALAMNMKILTELDKLLKQG